jgi:hypothetical protein
MHQLSPETIHQIVTQLPLTARTQLQTRLFRLALNLAGGLHHEPPENPGFSRTSRGRPYIWSSRDERLRLIWLSNAKWLLARLHI